MAMRPSFLRRASTTEVYTALRLPLVDKSRGTESTTAAALINAALAHSEGISAHQEPGGDHTVLIHRHRTAISLYYLAIDEASPSPSTVNVPPTSHISDSHDSGFEFGEHESFESAYQQHLRHRYPRLFGSGLLQELIPLQAGLKSLAVDVYVDAGSARELSLGARSTPQYFDDLESHANDSIVVNYVSDPIPFLSPTTTPKSHTTVLSLSSLSRQPHSHSSSSSLNSHTLRVPCYPLLLIEEAHSLAKFIHSLGLSPKIATTVESFISSCRHSVGRNKKLFKHDLREILKFFNVSHLVRLRHLEKENLPQSFGFDDEHFKIYARYAMSQETRELVQESLAVFEKFDNDLAWVVAREEARWPRWSETTSEHDHCDVYVEDAAKNVLGEWKEVTGLLKVLLTTKSLAAHVPISRQALEGKKRASF